MEEGEALRVKAGVRTSGGEKWNEERDSFKSLDGLNDAPVRRPGGIAVRKVPSAHKGGAGTRQKQARYVGLSMDEHGGIARARGRRNWCASIEGIRAATLQLAVPIQREHGL